MKLRLVSDTERWWRRAFLAERPSTLLGAFRIAVAVTVGCHMIPWFFPLEDTYLATAFREYNPSFFPFWTLQLVARSPDWLVRAFVGLFFLSWACFLIGWRSQASGIVMTLSCYYFYALNSLHIGTLSFDILLVTLFLMCVTSYHGDWLSLDSVLRGDAEAYKRPRPFFLQRLLQLQIASTFWDTALGKMTAGGNWLTDSPYYYLMHYPPEGVVRDFPFRGWLAQHPSVCDGLQVVVIVFEFALPVLLFWRRTRLVGLALGLGFHIMLLVTLHVPTIFFFLFPPQMALFLAPEPIVAWIEGRRAARAARGRATLLYDGHCGFCRESVRRLAVLDLFGYARPVDFHGVEDVTRCHRDLTPARCQRRMQLVEPVRLRSGRRPEETRTMEPIRLRSGLHPEETRRMEPDGRLSEGFGAFRRISLKAPMLWPIVPLLYLPGAGWAGSRAYDWVARRRFVFHPRRACGANQCGLAPASTPEDSSSKT